MSVERALMGGGALALLALLALTFATRWYGAVRLPRGEFGAGAQTAVGAWSELGALRWLTVLAAALALAAAAAPRPDRVALARAGLQRTVARAGLQWTVAAVGSFAALALVDRVLLDPPSPASVVDVKLGAYLAVLAATAIATGALAALRR
jgi:hypothetical protein